MLEEAKRGEKKNEMGVSSSSFILICSSEGPAFAECSYTKIA